ncbi:hypothetical protein [Streptosporangium canum]
MRSLAIAVTDSPSTSRSRAGAKVCALGTEGRPPLRPLAAAAADPAG